MDAAAQLEEIIRSVGAQVGPAVVGVGQRPAHRGRHPGEHPGRRSGWGSTGVVVGEGRVLTNAHNVDGPETTVTFADGRGTPGQVAAADVDGDVAVLTVDTGDAPPVAWADEPTGLGTLVVALANPGGRGLRATLGFVSATDQTFRGPRGRRITGSIEHSAPLAHGSSGGPLLDREGRVVGLNTNRLRGGFYLALPADADLRARVEALGRGERPRRVHLGLALAPPHIARRLRDAVGLPDREGLLVRGVEEGSPAERAGLRRGDLVIAADGRPVPSAESLFSLLQELDAPGTLDLTVVRGTDEITVTLDVGAPPTDG
ncbi:MAG: trypsin-like peptidase domain-containing protein [Egibacteraceae bacterium]